MLSTAVTIYKTMNDTKLFGSGMLSCVRVYEHLREKEASIAVKQNCKAPHEYCFQNYSMSVALP